MIQEHTFSVPFNLDTNSVFWLLGQGAYGLCQTRDDAWVKSPAQWLGNEICSNVWVHSCDCFSSEFAKNAH